MPASCDVGGGAAEEEGAAAGEGVDGDGPLGGGFWGV